MSTKKKARASKTVTVRGAWDTCESCGQYLPLHPDLGLCGACAFGEAEELMIFDGEWQEEVPDAHP